MGVDDVCVVKIPDEAVDSCDALEVDNGKACTAGLCWAIGRLCDDVGRLENIRDR